MNDTHPEIERVRIGLLRQAGPDRRGKLASQLSNQARWRSMQAIARAHPAWSELDRKLLFVEVHYGKQLASRVRAYILKRSA
ncbi:MAG: hypothetical protein IIB99_07780 [Planctomycetes bacterium]|nr:hypothetical protein [Planctomycetota bacterium]MCH8259090.1 hypothetical protein [Planctomycetota bacterium]